MTHGRFQNRRRPHPRPRKLRILVVCEGTTERNYLDEVRKDTSVSRWYALTVRKGTGGSRERIADRAIREKVETDNAGDPYHRVCCLMDVEDPSHREALKSACDNLKQAGVEVYLSHPNIEVWLLSHFEQTARPFADSNAVKACLKARWKKEFGSEYDETLLDIFRRLKDRTAKAINNARAVREKHHKGKKMFDANSSTEVYLLMSNLDVLGTADADKTPPRWNPPSCR